MRGAESELSKNYEICNNLQDFFEEDFYATYTCYCFLTNTFLANLKNLR